ncbi:hypothetical protein [Streptomyces sp. NBRC 110028]|nr:hypothetical protein [Streptomyces sp. NBRC 110028]
MARSRQSQAALLAHDLFEVRTLTGARLHVFADAAVERLTHFCVNHL